MDGRGYGLDREVRLKHACTILGNVAILGHIRQCEVRLKQAWACVAAHINRVLKG